MDNDTRFSLDEAQAGVGIGDAPALFRLRQRFPRPVEDIELAVAREMAPVLEGVRKGQRIAITGSSRGVANLARILRACVDALRQAGAEPFVVPAMGSHGGATAAGQIRVLAETHGITEESLGCPIESDMEVVRIGTTSTGFPVFQERISYEADGVLVVNRIKSHTGFSGRVESGICKMLVIGLGKQAGASRIHQQALREDMERLILESARIIVESERPRLIGAIGLLENAFKETASVRGIPVHDFEALVEAEGELLDQARSLLPRLPFESIDALIVDEIGKNISGSGMDTNIIGKKKGMDSPRIGAIYVRGLSQATHGNAAGIGFADLMPRALWREIDLASTYMNAFTAKRLMIARIPMMVENELQALQALLNFRSRQEPDSLRLLWIRNTSALDEMWASGALLDEARANPGIEILSPLAPLGFDEALGFELPPLP
ncbi:MAG: DUF2088 domain-containing protein [Ectothiorhodospiraceae bacterium AqS1]|nr:DUF2088 domain-containing protein [Ectothiorhodospiraceae bacterium AqS1]